MKTSWYETEQLEAYLLGGLDPGQTLVFEARLLLDQELSSKLQQQHRVHRLVEQYGRRQLKRELEQIHQHLFTAPQHHSFAGLIRRIFSKRN